MLIQSPDDPAVDQTITTAFKILRHTGYPVDQTLFTVLQAGVHALITDALQEREPGHAASYDCIRYRFRGKPYLALLTPEARRKTHDTRDGVAVMVAAVLPPENTAVRPDWYDQPMESFAQDMKLNQDNSGPSTPIAHAAKIKLIRATWRGGPVPHRLDRDAAHRQVVLDGLRPALPRPASG